MSNNPQTTPAREAVAGMSNRSHSLRRTSPKGGPFFGTCYQCGAENLPWDAIKQPCENPANLSQDEALLIAVKGSPA